MSSSDVSQRYEKYITETHYLFLCDVLVFKLNCTMEQTVCHFKSVMKKCDRFVTYETGIGAPELVELLQKSAVEHLTTYRHRQLQARDFSSIHTIVTTDFEALYAYKRGDYQRCLQLSTQNAKAQLVQRKYQEDVSTIFMFIQLFDDDIVSLKGLMLIVRPNSENVVYGNDNNITQLSLSLYLMTQCQLKLRHSLTSLAKTLDYIEVVQRNLSATRTLDHSTLSLVSRKIVMYTKSILQ